MMKGCGWEEEEEEEGGEEDTDGGEEGGGMRVACARHACASFWLLGMSFVIHLQLLFTEKIKTDNGRGSYPRPQFQDNFDFDCD